MAAMTECPVVGAMTPASAVIAVRTDAAAMVAIEADTNQNFPNPISSGGYQTVAADDYTAQIGFVGLLADTRYFYRVLVDGIIQDPGTVRRFDTFPTTGAFVAAVFADVAPLDRLAPCYAAAAQNDDPLFAVLLGDFPHENPSTLAEMRLMHRKMRDRSLQHGAALGNRILRRRAVVRALDDHDYGGNDTDRTFPGRADAMQAVREYWPKYPAPNPAGLWEGFVCCDAEFFVLDTRTQRDPNAFPDGPDKSMLDGERIGNDQLSWLLDGLSASTAVWKIILSTVTFNPSARANQDPPDSWRGFQTEAQVIRAHIEGNQIQGVVAISGDIHTGGGIDDGTNSLIGVPELTVPHVNLANGNRRNLGTWSEGVTSGRSPQGGPGYGVVEVGPTGLTLRAKAEDGTLRHSLALT